MINAFYTSKSGLTNYQNSLNVTSNNIANENTAGYKQQRADFTELLYNNLQGQAGAPVNLQSGSGVRLQEISKNFTQGIVENTGRNYDAAIKGDGFFATSDTQGNISFTRSGDFKLSSENGTNYLTTQNGDYVLDGNLQRITVAGDVQSAVLRADDGSAGDGIAVGVFNFSNPYALNMQGEGLYTQNAASGNPQLQTGAVIEQGSLERSNVDLITEMQKLIEDQRGFQMSAKIIQTADEMEQTANTLR